MNCREEPRCGTPGTAPGHRLVPPPGVADPSRGTGVAIGIPLVAALATVLWTAGAGFSLDTSLPIAAGLVLAHGRRAHRRPAPAAKRYTASTPVVVLAALVGGPSSVSQPAPRPS